MTQKNALDVTTKGWSALDIFQLHTTIDSLNFRWKAKVETKEGKIKYCYSYTKVDMNIMAIKQGFTILQVKKLV